MITLFLADIGSFRNHREELFTQITPAYAAKFRQNKIEENAMQELVCGYLLRRFLNVTDDNLLTWSAEGKPELADQSRYFNLAHSGRFVLLAVADVPVGVDIEDPRPYHPATARKVFTDVQRQMLELEDDAGKDRLFTRYWTELEAVLKLYGTGFGHGWEEARCRSVSYRTYMVDEYRICCATEQESSITLETVEYEPLKEREQ